jgi:anti-sigma B factor antagonist
MRIIERQRGYMTVLDVHGALTAPSGSAMLRGSVRRLVQAGRLHLVVDLQHVAWADAGGIGALVDAHNVMTAHDGTFCLTAGRPYVSDLLALTGLSTIFDVFDTVDAAIRDGQPSSSSTADSAAMRP